MAAPLTAYIDMEFAGIYGTRQTIQIPIEIGVVLHDPETDTPSFAGKPFSYDIDVELWKNVTDEMGNGGSSTSESPGRPGSSIENLTSIPRRNALPGSQ